MRRTDWESPLKCKPKITLLHIVYTLTLYLSFTGLYKVRASYTMNTIAYNILFIKRFVSWINDGINTKICDVSIPSN